MMYEVSFSDGTWANMSLAADTDPRLEIARWRPERAAQVTAVTKVTAFRDLPAQPVERRAEAVASQLPDDVRDLMMQMATMVSEDRQRAEADRARISSLEGTMDALRGAV